MFEPSISMLFYRTLEMRPWRVQKALEAFGHDVAVRSLVDALSVFVFLLYVFSMNFLVGLFESFKYNDV